MSPRLVSEAHLIDRLTDVFRTVGFDGASLSDLAATTGLQKSSLYHRFPGGKSQMAIEVLHHLGNDIVASAMAPLDSDEPIVTRIRTVGEHLIAFYEGGAKSCLLDTMSLGAVGPGAHRALADAAARWVDAFARVAAESGASPAVALARGQDAIAAIEGGLVLARATGDTSSFLRAIEQLPDTLLGAAATTRRTRKEH